MEEGKLFTPRNVYRLFAQKDLANIRRFLRKHHVDVNACFIAGDIFADLHYSVVSIALRCFDRSVMACLLEEFGADLSMPCHFSHEPRKQYSMFPVFCAMQTAVNPIEAVEYVLEHGGTILDVDVEDMEVINPQGVRGQTLLLIEYAKTRCRTAWALVWTLSQLTGTLWPDMSEALAKMIRGMPLREFSRDSVKRPKK